MQTDVSEAAWNWLRSARGSGHLGTLGMFALEAGEQGMFAMLCQRTPPIMALPGSAGRAIVPIRVPVGL
ncbi:MAG: hypothetical protein JWQ23_1688 [Herminiimonas sp.]|nr:hypothetical protein [Herminiimonas sp.]